MAKCSHTDCDEQAAFAAWFPSAEEHRAYCQEHYRTLVNWGVPLERTRVVE